MDASNDEPLLTPDGAHPTLVNMELRVRDLTREVQALRKQIALLRVAARPPRPPLRVWLRHRLKTALGLRVMLGRLSFDEPPRPVYVPRWYHTRPAVQNPPTISIATPSYNQGAFLEHTIQSVLSQGYPNLQYVVQDGGSTDDTADVIARHRPRLHHAEMRKDNGQSHAINLGLARTDGELMAYLNSDDVLLPGTLWAVAKYFEDHPDVDVVYGHRVVINEDGYELGRWVLPGHQDEVLRWADYVPQETMFWRRRIWDKAGGRIDESFRFAMDWDLLLRFLEAGAKFHRLPRFLGGFRVHTRSKTMTVVNTQGQDEMARLRRRAHGRDVTYPEVNAAIRGYLAWHVVHNRLYRLGLLRY
ncbi:MAG: glycosyltransferase [Gemmataceae bacterium]|nr:glycosyltransferase [Gemmataceae bacterium]